MAIVDEWVVAVGELVVDKTGLSLFSSILILAVFFTVLLVIKLFPKSGPNPLAQDTRQPPRPLVTDPAARDKVLKQGFATKKVPEELDVIVIGSGIGGLTVANLLSRVGKRVLVLEQHDQAGGLCHTFVEKGFEFDVGIHYIGEMGNGQENRVLVDHMTDGQLQWDELHMEHDLVVLGPPGKERKYPIVGGGPENFRRKMKEMFPNDGPAIDKFIKLILETHDSTVAWVLLKVLNKSLAKLLIKTGLLPKLSTFMALSDRSVTESLKEITDNEELRAVLAYGFGDYGVIPKDASMAMHLSLLHHFMGGAYFPRGGSSEIAMHMIPPIERAGGRVLVRASVSQILTKKKKVPTATLR